MKDKNKELDYFYTKDMLIEKNTNNSLKSYFLKLLIVGIFATITFLIIFVVVLAIKES